MDGWDRWIKVQIGDSPGMGLLLAGIAFAVAGLCLSLFVRPRRVWIRVRPDGSSSALVEVAGLDRADARAGLVDDIAELADELAAGVRKGGHRS